MYENICHNNQDSDMQLLQVIHLKTKPAHTFKRYKSSNFPWIGQKSTPEMHCIENVPIITQ